MSLDKISSSQRIESRMKLPCAALAFLSSVHADFHRLDDILKAGMAAVSTPSQKNRGHNRGY